MRVALSIMIPLALVAAVGYGLCMGMGWNPHATLLGPAAGVALIASLLAMIPLRVARNASQPAVVQASLVGTMVHLFACAIAAAVAAFASSKPGLSFTLWLLVFYWATLAGVASVYVKAVRRAPIESSGKTVATT